jgi:hypothetical protein
MGDLKGADAWLYRAEEHLADFQEISAPLIDTEIDATISSLDFDPNPNNVPYKVPSLGYRTPHAEIPPRASVLIGEFIQALRRSLDYLIYELAMFDSGLEQHGTQFPIDDRKDVFWARLAKNKQGITPYLIGVDPKHAAVIERYQPYNGADWTKTLQSISNPDKHRHLIFGKHSSSTGIMALQDRADQTPTRTKDGFIVGWNPNDSVHMQLHVSVFVAFDDETPIYQTLNQIKTEVGNVLEEFRPCFSGQCHH